MSAREDLLLIQQTLELSDAHIAHKALLGTPEYDPEAAAAASAALNAHRVLWRGIREYVIAQREQEWAAAQEQESSE